MIGLGEGRVREFRGGVRGGLEDTEVHGMVGHRIEVQRPGQLHIKAPGVSDRLAAREAVGVTGAG